MSETVPPVTAEEFVKLLNAYYAGALTNVESIPVVRLRDWRVFQVDEFEHFVGWNMQLGTGWVSSPIVEFALNCRVARTESGRIYVLEGPPGNCPEADRVFARWQIPLKPTDVVNVTDAYDHHQRAANASPTSDADSMDQGREGK